MSWLQANSKVTRWLGVTVGVKKRVWDSRISFKWYTRNILRATPLLRVKVKITVKNAVCESLPRQHTAFLTVNLTLTLKRGFALTGHFIPPLV